ncbi:MAG: TraB/GumN family protein [Pseudomonadota bacterium]
MKSLVGIFLLSWSAVIAAQPQAQTEAPEEIIVTGRLPGPALWKVSNGENALWIFAVVSPIPKDMEWESQRVEQVIAEADEYLEAPDVEVSISPMVMLNPVNLLRGYRLLKRLQANPGKQSLQEVLPPELYQRFSALKAQYAPHEKAVEKMRPLFAVGQINESILEQNGLTEIDDVIERINLLIKRNRTIIRTSTEVTMTMEGGFGDLAGRAEAMVSSLPFDKELACMERQLVRYESDIKEMRSRANSWAQGHVDELRDMPLPGESDDPCLVMVMGSSESQTMAEIELQSQHAWLAAADKALANNQSTFAVLGISDLLSETGLLAQLKAKGYAVREPQ